MARRRQISTEISVDTAVNRMAQKHGDFAVLLYTWMIPHADEDATLTGDPEEILYSVIPGRRDKSEEDVIAALNAMVEFNLIEWDRINSVVGFPAESFYKYQSQIKEDRRRKGSIFPDLDFGSETGQRKTAPNRAESRETPPDRAEHHQTPEITASSSFTSSSSTPNGVSAQARKRPPKPKHQDLATPLYAVMFETVLRLWLGLDWKSMSQEEKASLTEGERGRVNKAVGQLVKAGATCEEVTSRWAEAVRRADGEYDVVPESLTKRWTSLSNDRVVPRVQTAEEMYGRLP